MALSRSSELFMLFCLSVLVSVESSNPHFRGGFIHWKLENFDETQQKYNVSFTYEFSWDLGYGPCGPHCSDNDVGSIGKHPGPEIFVCEEGCVGKPKLSNAAYKVTQISKSEQWEAGRATFFTVFDSTGPFKVAIEGKEWVYLNIVVNGNWRLQTELNLGKRSDTNYPNNSPITVNGRLYQMFSGCSLPIKISTMDADGDRVRCRWANTPEECGGVCNSLPGSVLDPDSCTIHPKALLSYGYGHYAASIVVEDFPYSEVTINGKVYNPTTPFSQIPTQFLIYANPTSLLKCSQPEFINPPWVDGQVIVVPPTHTFKETVCAKSTGDNPMNGFSVTGPEGIKTINIIGVERGSMCVNLEWTPTVLQLGGHLLCVTTEEADGIASQPLCVTLHVDGLDSCKSGPCPSGLSCVDLINGFSCLNRTVPASNHTDITSGVCLQNVLDLVFALDSSNSLTPADQSEMKRFMSELVQNFGIGQNKGHVGVVTYDDSPHLVFDLNTYNLQEDVLAAIANVTFGYGGSDTGGALKFVQEEMFSAQRGDREYVPNVLVVLTDGHSKHSFATQYYAKAARNLGISIFAVGVGPNIDVEELKKMASKPLSKYMLTVDTFEDLKSISDYLVNTTCTVRLPNETVSVKTTPKPGCYDVAKCVMYGEGVCTDYPGWSSDNCKQWCGFCHNGTTTVLPCLDVLANCHQYSSDVCTKPELRIWAMEHCRAYCGFPPCVSTPSPATTTSKPTTPGICEDRLDDCAKYGKAVCSSPDFTGWAKDNCAAFCVFCTEYNTVTPSTIDGIQCPAWKLPTECTMESYSASCCPLPKCPAGFKLTVEKPHL